jgi:hypothetical protein
MQEPRAQAAVPCAAAKVLSSSSSCPGIRTVVVDQQTPYALGAPRNMRPAPPTALHAMPCPPGPVVLAHVVPCFYRRLGRGRGRVGVPALGSGVVSRLSCSRAPGVLLRTSNGSAPSHAWVRQARQLPAPAAASNLRQAPA